MSKFMDQIHQIRIDGNKQRIALPGSPTTIRVDVVKPASYTFAQLHRIEARVGVSVYLQTPTEVGVVRGATNDVQNMLAEEVYGDVRRIITNMWGDVYELRDDPQQWERSERIVAKLHAILAEITP